MKSRVLITSCLLFFGFLSCETSQSATSSRADELADYLRSLPGLSVIGKGEFATVRVRGLAEYYGEGEPLFVVNGQEVTGGFNALSNRVNATEIRSVRVLKHSSDLIKYGNMGVNGVVEISLN